VVDLVPDALGYLSSRAPTFESSPCDAEQFGHFFFRNFVFVFLDEAFCCAHKSPRRIWIDLFDSREPSAALWRQKVVD